MSGPVPGWLCPAPANRAHRAQPAGVAYVWMAIPPRIKANGEGGANRVGSRDQAGSIDFLERRERCRTGERVATKRAPQPSSVHVIHDLRPPGHRAEDQPAASDLAIVTRSGAAR